MSAASPNVQQRGDEDALLSPSVSHEDDGAKGGETPARDHDKSDHDAAGANSIGREQAKRSRWPWRRSNKEEQQAEGREEAGKKKRGKGEKRQGLFTYDWDNGERILWKASKRSRAEVVSQFGSRLLHGSYINVHTHRASRLAKNNYFSSTTKQQQMTASLATFSPVETGGTQTQLQCFKFRDLSTFCAVGPLKNTRCKN